MFDALLESGITRSVHTPVQPAPAARRGRRALVKPGAVTSPGTRPRPNGAA